MSVVAASVAWEHLRADPDYPDDQITRKLDAAEKLASEYMARRIYADADALTAAISAVPAGLIAAGTEYASARETAFLIEDAIAQEEALAHADRVYADARTTARETYAGIAINPAIEAAILMTLSNLYDLNRGGSVELPSAARELLHPFRVGLGV